MSEFVQHMVSISGAPAVDFHFRGDTVRAELAGAQLYIEAGERDGGARMTLKAADGELLADVTVHPRSHRNLTENVTDIGCALLWSHWRHCEAERAASEEANRVKPDDGHAFEPYNVPSKPELSMACQWCGQLRDAHKESP